MLSVSPLLAWFFTLLLVLLAGRAVARIAVERGGTGGHRGTGGTGGHGAAPVRRLSVAAGHRRELGHAAMGLGMAALLAPGLPRPPHPVTVCFFSVLAALALLDWGRGLWAGWRGRVAQAGGCVPAESGRLLDSHHAIVGVAMVVMLLRPGGASPAPGVGAVTGVSGALGAGLTGTGTVAMPGMVMGAAPSATMLVLLGYVWLAALALGYGMTRMLGRTPPGPGMLGTAEGGGSGALLGSPATVYACELAMTVLTGLMLLS